MTEPKPQPKREMTFEEMMLDGMNRGLQRNIDYLESMQKSQDSFLLMFYAMLLLVIVVGGMAVTLG